MKQTFPAWHFVALGPNDPEPLSARVAQVTLDRAAVWTCAPQAFEANVLPYYDGCLHAWPDANALRRRFLQMPADEQRRNMTLVADYFVLNPPANAPEALFEFLLHARSSLGMYDIALRRSLEPEAFVFDGARAARARAHVSDVLDNVATVKRNASHLASLDALTDGLEGVTLSSSDGDDIWHQLWLLGERATIDNTRLFYRLDKLNRALDAHAERVRVDLMPYARTDRPTQQLLMALRRLVHEVKHSLAHGW